MHPDFNEHLNGTPNLHLFNDLAVALVLYILQKQRHEALFDLGMQYDIMLKLGSLHLLDWLEFNFRNVVFVHVKQDVLDHNDAQLLVSPQFV